MVFSSQRKRRRTKLKKEAQTWMDVCIVYVRKSKFFCYVEAAISNDAST